MLNLLIAILPGLAWLWYFYRKDRFQPEPTHLVLVTFVAGAAMVVPAGWVEATFLKAQGITGSLTELGIRPLALAAFLVIGPVEESLKLLAAWICIGRSCEFDEPMDGVVYLAAAGLGFAAAENLVYSQVTDSGALLARGLFSCCLHASTSGLVGYSWSLVRFKNRSRATLVLGWSAAVAVHGAYDMVAFGQPKGWLMAMGTVLVLVDAILAVRISHALSDSPFRPPDEPSEFP